MKDWTLVEELFSAAVDLAPEERGRLFVERGVDAALRARVEALVAAARRPEARLEGTAADLVRELAEPHDPAALCGLVCGPYRLEAHVSSGGMGDVYRATRTSAGIERRVALKVLRPGLDSAGVVARFQRERATLAALEHESIVRFLDAGALPDGRPYLVMELVEGVPLSDWDPAGAVGVPDRLRLLVRILGAVQYAHRQLVVHRDLKPSNVLVDARGRPKLLDFGVAALLDAVAGAPGTGDAEPAAPGPEPLTPSYASPEQLAGAPVGCASDVYSLGVLAHELLTGRLPRPAGPARSPGTFEPASALATNPRVARALAGDLDAILARALARDPAARYASADAFADDLVRHLEHLPVAARPGGPGVRAGRLLRRHPWPVALGLASLLALAAGWIGSDLARRRASTEASLGWGAHAQVKRVARLFEDWIAGAAQADASVSAAVTADLQAQLAGELEGCPESEALVRLALARLWLQAGDRDAAAREAGRVLDIARETRGLGRGDLERAEQILASARGTDRP